MNIAIIDDMQADRLWLEQSLLRYDRIHQLGISLSHFDSGDAFLQAYQPFKYAVIFLDIYMNGISGIEVANRIRETDEDVILVFLTISMVHYAEAFSVFASSYLNKSCSEEQLLRTLNHIFHIKLESEKYFTFSFNRKNYALRSSDIVFLETSGNYLSITDRNGNKYQTRMTFSAAHSHFDERFLILMKGILVNMEYIIQISDRQCLLLGGTVLPVHVKNQKNLRERWLNYKFAKIRKDTAELGSGS